MKIFLTRGKHTVNIPTVNKVEIISYLRLISKIISEVRGATRCVLLARQISLALRNFLVTFVMSRRFIVMSPCSNVYVSSISPSKCHVTFGGGEPPITSHNKDNTLPSLNGCNTFAKLLPSSV